MIAQIRRERVLVVDDEPDNLDLMVRSLRADFEVLTATNGAEALRVLAEHDVSVIITDQRMPGMTGVEFLREASQSRPDVKRLLLTAYADADSLIQAINEGRVHYYIRKPWDRHQLRATVGELVHLRRLEEENRRIAEDLARVNRELADREKLLAHNLDERGKELLVANTALRAANDSLAKLAYRDGLTGLYNHRSFQERLREEVSRSLRYGKPLSLAFMDIDHFKRFNDRFGHPAGDEVLKSIGRLLLGQLDADAPARESDVAARYGGEELVIILPETNRTGAAVKAERLRQAVARMTFNGEAGAITMSFGVAECPSDARGADELLLAADQALYLAKRNGRDRVEVYTSEVAAEEEAASEPPPGPLPTLAACSQEAISFLVRDGYLAVLYVDLVDLANLEREYGPTVYAETLGRLARVAARISTDTIRAGDLVTSGFQDQPSFVVFLSGPRSGGRPATGVALQAICERVTQFVQSAVDRELLRFTRAPARVSVGYALGLGGHRAGPERQLAMLVREAAACARLNGQRAELEAKAALQLIILGGRLRPLFQPIVNAADGKTLGYEALARGPAGSAMEGAYSLFQAAAHADLQWELDCACLKAALNAATGLTEDQLLFLNVLPSTFFDRAFLDGEFPVLVAEAGLSPSRVVLEVVEQYATGNLERFREAVESMRARGFRIALDDVGTATANLQQVQSLAPDFLKLDISIVRGVSGAPTRCELIRSLVRLGEGFAARCVAEGVETEADFEALREAGVPYVQGFHIARPGSPFPPPGKPAR